MRRPVFVGLALCLAATASEAQDPLRVLRHSPSDTASPSNIITIMFDRPVAGLLDRTVAAASIIKIEPPIPGKTDWRDPVTIRFVPAEPLTPGRQITVTVSDTVRAIDGSRLAAPYRFSFRVPGPRLLARSFDTRYEDRGTLPPAGNIQLLYSAPIDRSRLERGARVTVSKCPNGAPDQSIALRVARERSVANSDPYYFQWYDGQYDRDTVGDGFRRVVELVPASPLPLDCDAKIALPTTIDEASYGREEVYGARTAPVFRFAALDCGVGRWCAMNRLKLTFTSRVTQAEVERRVRVEPATKFIVGGDYDGRTWWLVFPLEPRTTYSVVVDTAIRDVFHRPLDGPRRLTINTGDRNPRLTYARGLLTIPRDRSATMPVRVMNASRIRIVGVRIPEDKRQRTFSNLLYYVDAIGQLTGTRPETTWVSVTPPLNTDTTVEVPIPADAFEPNSPLVALRLEIAALAPSIAAYRPDGGLGDPTDDRRLPYTVIQSTDLAAHLRLSRSEATVYVTGASDGRPRPGVLITDIDGSGVIAAQDTTDAQGLAWLGKTTLLPAVQRRAGPFSDQFPPIAHLIQATLGNDRLILPLGMRRIGYAYSNPLDPSELGGRIDDAPEGAGAIFFDRAIYRPGEMLYLKAVARRGLLGELERPVPGDSARIVVRERNMRGTSNFSVRDTIVRLSSFGTFADSIPLRGPLPLGEYDAGVELIFDQRWQTVGTASFTVAEYRAPEFVVDLKADTVPRFSGDTVTAFISARYLFGAPMGRVTGYWSAVTRETGAWDLHVPRTTGWIVGETAWWDNNAVTQPPRSISGNIVLDERGRSTVRIPVTSFPATQPGRVSIDVAVIDANRQMVTASTGVVIQPSRIYVAARPAPRNAPWTPGQPAHVWIRAVSVDGADVSGTRVIVTTLRRRWADVSGRATWAAITLRTDTVVTRADSVDYAVTPDSAGWYEVKLSASDNHGGITRTSFAMYAIGGNVRLERRGPFTLPLVAEHTRLSVGDVARIHFDCPFDSADAWITTEREGTITQRFTAARRGDNLLTIPIEARHVPNVWVSVTLFAHPGSHSRPDSAAQRLRTGYAEIVVDASPRRLSVSVAPEHREYAPGDSVAVRVHVRDASGNGVRSEVALWAVDEGVLALAAYDVPDLTRRIYQPRGLNQRLRSSTPLLLTNDPSLDASLAAIMFMQLSEVVATSAANATISIRGPSSVMDVRRTFRSTAFFLGNIVTNDGGDVIARPRLPDNLTTYRVMAVAIDTTNRFGHGDTSFVITRPLVARASLPRFVRPSDSLRAGAVINARDGLPRSVDIETSADGVGIIGPARARISLPRGAGVEGRFDYVIPPRDRVRDTVVVRVGATDGTNADASETRIPVRPDFHPRAHTVIGIARGSADIVVPLPAGVDPDRSRVRIRVGTSPLVPMLAAFERLRVYPYYCTEQISSIGRSLIAVWRATRRNNPTALGGDPLPRLQQLADELASRQNVDGSISYWRGDIWHSAWLSAYAGLFLLEARDVGVAVDSGVVGRIADYVRRDLKRPIESVGLNRFEQSWNRLALGARVASVDFLRRAGTPDGGAEDSLIAVAARLTWEDRLRLAEVLSTRNDRRGAALALLDAAWRAVIPVGNRVDLPDTARSARVFPSRVAPAARLLTATLSLDREHPLTGGLIETVLQQGRAEQEWAWNTQDYASVVLALAAIADTGRSRPMVRVIGRNGLLVETIDSTETIPLTDRLEMNSDKTSRLSLRVETGAGDRVFYSVQVDEVPLVAPTRPDIQGIVVERWYERYSDGAPITSIAEGEIVRVRLRVTVPTNRQFVAVEDPLPAGLEPIDTRLRTSATLAPFISTAQPDPRRNSPMWQAWLYGSWDEGWWSPWEHKELRDDRVIYFARMLWAGSYTASYVARATTSGNFIRPPAHAEEMYNPALQGRSDGGRFLVTRKN